MPPVLGVMARAPVPGRCKTRLGRVLGDERAAALYRAMLLDTLAGLTPLAFERHVVCAAPEDDGAKMLSSLVPEPWSVIEQAGDALGARLIHVASALGPGPVVLVSSDSPTMPFSRISLALPLLQEPDTVLLGACPDGGYYLIGLCRPELRVFDEIAWSTPLVAEQTRARCHALGLRVEELPLTLDVDEPEDIPLLRAELASDRQKAPLTAGIVCAP